MDPYVDGVSGLEVGTMVAKTIDIDPGSETARLLDEADRARWNSEWADGGIT